MGSNERKKVNSESKFSDGEVAAADVLKRLESEDLFKRPVSSRLWDCVKKREISRLSIAVGFFFMFGLAASLWHIYVSIFGRVQTFYLRPIHLLFIMGLGLFIYNWSGNRREFNKLTWKLGVDILLFIVLAAATLYPAMGPGEFQIRHGFGTYQQLDYVMAALILVILAEMMRRTLGYIFLIFVLLFFAYTMFGQGLPGVLGHAGVGLEEFLTYQYMSTSGLWGTPIGVMARYVVLFIIFGALLDVTKGGLMIQRFGNKITGGSPGGPAKIAIVTSSLMGTISGSALANITTTGSFTIPLMKRTGYNKEDAAGIEAAASSGGQFAPPIMGAVAFIMAAIAGVSYLTVITVALVPAILYYVSLFTSAHVSAKYHNLASVPESALPSWGDVWELAHMVIPIIALIGALVLGYSVIYAALFGIITIILAAVLRSSTRPTLEGTLNGLYTAADTAVIATVACAGAGVIVGMVQLSGLGTRLSSAIIGMSAGYTFFALFFVMVVTILMGLGMPTVPAYAITVAIGLPALLELGLNPLASHMFIIYFAVISLITPPVMVGTFAAASLADADPIKAGFSSVRFALIAFVVPYMFILNPELLIVAVDVNPFTLIYYILTAIAGAVIIGMGSGGYALSRLNSISRLVLIVAGIGLLDTQILTDFVAVIGIFASIKYSLRSKSGVSG